MKNVIESIEEDQKHNNTRKMYQTVNHTHTHTHTQVQTYICSYSVG